MNELLGLIIFGLASAALYAVAASGLVVTYTTSGIFNFAHGAVAMVSAFVYWQLSSPDAWGLPVPFALAITLFAFAPGLGWVIDRFLMRRLDDAGPITRIVVPIGLLVALIQISTVIWPPTVTRSVPRFFDNQDLTIGGVGVEYHQIVIMVVALLVAVGLRSLLYASRVGVAMRAVVDSRELAALNGASPGFVSSLSWALGCMLAAVAGVLIAPILTLDATQLTLLVVNAYAAAMVGRLRSLPMTVVGAIILGFAREATARWGGDLPGPLPDWVTVETIPAIMLFIVLLVVPQDKAELFGRRPDRTIVPHSSLRTVVIGGVGLVVAAVAVGTLVEGSALDTIGYGVCLGIVALSLVPLTGFGGQISLAPLTFAGVGALVMWELGSDGNPLALVAVAAVCAAVGALVALPTLKLKGLYLALATMAFALFCEKGVFRSVAGFSQGDAAFERLHLGPISTESNRANLILLAVTFGLLAVLVTALRLGPAGRRLQAMKDSPAACATLGLSTTRLKLEAFALSAAIAGIGGALLGGWRGKVGTEQFALLEGPLPGLPLVLMAVVGGIASVAGVLVGALLFAGMPLVGATYPALLNLMTVLPGLAGISLAANPNGIISQIGQRIETAREKRSERRGLRAAEPDRNRYLALLVPAPPELAPERLVVGGTAVAVELAAIDDEVGLSWGRCDADPRSA